MQVIRGVHRFTHGIANFYLYEDPEGLTLVDAGVRADWRIFTKAMATLGRSPKDLSAVILTHAHADHTGFAERARSSLGSRVWVHEADLATTGGAPVEPQEGRFGPYLRYWEAWRTLFGLLAHGGVRIVPIHEASSFVDGERLDVPGNPRVVHVPGHTRGMTAVVLERAEVIFTGDALVTRNPLTGRRGPQIMPRALNRDSRQALESLEKLAGLPAQHVLPGHGDPWARGIAEAVRQAHAAGYS